MKQAVFECRGRGKNMVEMIRGLKRGGDDYTPFIKIVIIIAASAAVAVAIAVLILIVVFFVAANIFLDER